VPADYKRSLRGLEGSSHQQELAACHQRSADRLLALCFANGGIYIKLGQHIGQLVSPTSLPQPPGSHLPAPAPLCPSTLFPRRTARTKCVHAGC
jgi:hypothetical protein